MVAQSVHDVAVPVQVNVMADRPLTKKMRAVWTPTFLFVDGEEVEQHRFMGFYPPDEFAAQVQTAAAKDAFAKGRYDEALKRYSGIVERLGATDAAPEALYWTGVCEFKLTKDAAKINEKCRAVVQRYPNHIMAKKLAFMK